MSKVTGRLLIAVIVLLAVSNWLLARRATAQPQAGYGQAACMTYIPASWGEYVGSSEHYGIAFKDDAGTLRFLTNIPCQTTPQIALQVKRTNPTN